MSSNKMDSIIGSTSRANWLSELVADCSDAEVKLITDMALALKTSLRRLNTTWRLGMLLPVSMWLMCVMPTPAASASFSCVSFFCRRTVRMRCPTVL